MVSVPPPQLKLSAPSPHPKRHLHCHQKAYRLHLHLSSCRYPHLPEDNHRHFLQLWCHPRCSLELYHRHSLRLYYQQTACLQLYLVHFLCIDSCMGKLSIGNPCGLGVKVVGGCSWDGGCTSCPCSWFGINVCGGDVVIVGVVVAAAVASGLLLLQ